SSNGTAGGGAGLSSDAAGSMSQPPMAPPVAADASCAGAASAASAMPSLKRQAMADDAASMAGIGAAGAAAAAASGATAANGARRAAGLCEPGSVALAHGVHAVCRGTKRRGSDSSVVLMAVGASDRSECSLSAYSTQTSSTIAAVCAASPAASSRKRRSLDSSPPDSPASPAGLSPLQCSPALSLSPSPSPATLGRPACGGSALGSASSQMEGPLPIGSQMEGPLLPRSARRLLLAPQLMALSADASGGSGNLRKTHAGGDGLSVPRDSGCTTTTTRAAPESVLLARARATSSGDINSSAQQHKMPAAAPASDRRTPPPSTAAAATAAAFARQQRLSPGRPARGSGAASVAVVGALAPRPIALSSPTAFSGSAPRPRSAIPAGAVSAAPSSTATNAASASAPAAPTPTHAPAPAPIPTSRAHRQAQSETQHQQHQPAPKPSAASAPGAAKAQVCTLPPINRYTLRELKIQNILQNPRLRHEVLFEPKLEFRPNSSGQLAEAKQRAAAQYWAAVDHGLRKNNSSAVSTLTMLLVELREILAEMAEDSPRPELSRHAPELRERLDEERLRQQIAHGVFDAEPVVRYLATVMRVFAQAAAAQREGAVVHDAAISRVLAYVQRGRVVRALRAAFDVLEAIKIDTANGSIEMYREYMRSTAVTFERSHFSLALQRSSLSLADTTEWWRRAVEGGCGSGDGTPSSAAAASTFAAAAAAASSGGGLDAIFAEAARELILDEGQGIPGLFRMDEGRIQGIRREAERLAIVGMVFLAFSQFLQLVASSRSAVAAGAAAVAPVVGEFKNANGRVEYERLAAECLLIVPEGCAVKWTEPLIAAS
ncbi:cAMP-mediated signaling protein sok1, partial [Coemansia sp. RSA 2424]